MGKNLRQKEQSKAPWKDRPTRFDGLDEVEIAKRWKALRPKVVKALLFFMIVTLTLFTYNHYLKPVQALTNVVNVAFQIACVFSVLLMLLGIMSWFYGRVPVRKHIES